MESFVVSSSPFIHSKNDINKMFLYVSVALMIPAVFAILNFGFYAFLICLTSVAACFVSESLFNLITKSKFKVDDFSFFVTGMILALSMPAKTPIYVVCASAFFAIFVVKMAFGGLGRNKFNPALTARCFAGIVASGLSSALYETTIDGEVYVSLTQGGENILYNMLLGKSVGGIGTTCVLVLAFCYAFMVYSDVLDFKIPIIAILSYFIVGLTQHGIEPTLINMCSGSFLFVSIFMMTDPNTSPNTLLGKFLYSALFGVLSYLVWSNGTLGENSIFVVALFVNLLAPFMDKYLAHKPYSFGGFRNAHKN